VEAMLAEGVRPDALVCGTDSMAVGAMSALWGAGLRVPEDLSVAGFDDIADGEFASPPLSTVHFDKRVYAAAALGRLMARIEGSEAPATRIAVPAEIRRRASIRDRRATAPTRR
jgi:LacI family repressor for deo operon, udp, cdd, tsx, nupC, and nupG